MTEATLNESRQPGAEVRGASAPLPPQPCGECLGSGGWFRYEPALDPAPGRLYLSCVQCRGSGRTAEPRA